ncbi:MAG: F0F1 ATP synthase subunit A [Acidobacteria bacterium]|nr:F0F1 ATP synthase subunit A [Acidobacteriota bacterium]
MSDTAQERVHTVGPEAPSTSEVLDPAVHGGGEHGEDIGQTIMRHVTDSNTLELPFVGEVHLPHLEIGGVDLSITKHVVMMWLASLLIIMLFSVTLRNRRTVPRGLANLLEMLVVFVRDELAVKNIGEEGKRFAPYLLTTFFFILTCNLLGLVPYMATATGNISVTAGLAIVAFLVVQMGGVQAHGFVGYVKNFVPQGVPLWLYPLLFPIEILGMLIKHFVLCVRLFANMLAGHFVLVTFICLIFVMKSIWVAPISVSFALFVSLLEILVAIIQAYIFAMLASLFIGMAVHSH